ncbi:MAG: hypothetical protein ABEJ95_07655 [Candidatus Nanohalobium sp.]
MRKAKNLGQSENSSENRLQSLIVLLIVYPFFGIIFGVLLIAIFPVIAQMFSIIGIFSEAFLEWYINTKNPVSWKYISGFAIGTCLLSSYIYLAFHRNTEFSEINKSKLLFPSALTVASLRWLPDLGLELTKRLDTFVEGTIYALPFIVFVYFVEYKLDRNENNLPSNQTTLKEAKHTNVLRKSRSLFLSNEITWRVFVKQLIRVKLLKLKPIERVKRTPDFLILKIISQNKLDIFSYVYLSLVLGLATYIAEKIVVSHVKPLFTILVLLYLVLLGLVYLVWNRFSNWMKESLDIIEEDSEQVVKRT